MADVIVIMILGLCVGGAIRYIYKSKKSGAKCIGCPHSCSCSGNCSGSANNGNTKARMGELQLEDAISEMETQKRVVLIVRKIHRKKLNNLAL